MSPGTVSWITEFLASLSSEDGAKISTISEGGAKAPEWI
jgi:hypothetical protein